MPDQATVQFGSVPIALRVAVGTAHPTLSELSTLGAEDIIQLDRSIEDPVEVFAGEKLVARGELIELEDNPGRLGIRIVEIVSTGT